MADDLFAHFDDAFGQFYGLKRKRRSLRADDSSQASTEIEPVSSLTASGQTTSTSRLGSRR